MSGAALNAFHNIWLRQATGNPDLTLTVNNHPLPRTAQSQVHVHVHVRVCTESSVDTH